MPLTPYILVLVKSRLLSGHLLVILVISCFGFEGKIWVLSALVPGHCLLVAFNSRNRGMTDLLSY